MKLFTETGSNHSYRTPLAEMFPEVAAELHPSKNGDLTPQDVSYGSADHQRLVSRRARRATAGPPKAATAASDERSNVSLCT